ncbi:hypothetical protein [Planctomyces sp. SH-PL14]|uniref:hypothetical protein n=1 Tax=Planctomyces sp. SH-PL14 TaxID=1632864 RepID=UPI00078D1A1A|nr:hypothetical protein [Planctomyces sp. SH-PL14]AMV17447.1 hypothetical protein VT03_06120 [Planctomyces sp. SH-PL14]
MRVEFLGAAFLDEASGRGLAGVAGVLAGSLITWAVAQWKRRKERQSVLSGNARDSVVIAQHIVESEEREFPDGTKRRVARTMRIRSLGQERLSAVIPNGHLASIFSERSEEVTMSDPLISMDGVEGTFLLETLTNFVCDRIGNEPFDHDQYVMTPCCEPAELAQHQPITILLVSRSDLELFESFETCREVQVEHSSDGARILTLMTMASQFREEQKVIRQRRAEGESVRFAETMYLLDLALDRRAASFPSKSVQWQRYEALLPATASPDRSAVSAEPVAI